MIKTNILKETVTSETFTNLFLKEKSLQLNLTKAQTVTFEHVKIVVDSKEVVTRNRLSYKTGLSRYVKDIYLPEVDALGVLRVESPVSKLFKELKEKGLDSYLIDVFAGYEEKGMPYLDPQTGELLFESYKVETKAGLGSGRDLLTYHQRYRMHGGSGHFYRIMDLDRMFFKKLLEGMNLGLCSISRIDMCLDLTENIMYHIAEHIKQGTYAVSSRKVHMFGYIGGKRYNGQIGKYTKIQQSGDLEKKKVEIETVYFGMLKNSSRVAVFYDKEAEERSESTRSSLNDVKSRIEVRVAPGPLDEKLREDMKEFLSSYYDEIKGWKKRLIIYATHLLNVVQFTNIKNCSLKKEKRWELADWYRNTFELFVTALVDTTPEEEELKEYLPKTSVLLFPKKSKRGRPKGSKNKTAEEKAKMLTKVRRKRGRPRGSSRNHT